MRKPLMAAALVGLAACSDYDLYAGKEGSEGDDVQGDTDTQAPDSGEPGEDTSDPGEDSPLDGLPEGPVDVVLLLDIAYWYDCYHPDLALNGAALIDALFDSGADVALSIATYDDYDVEGEWWVASGGVPYRLRSQLTTNRSSLKSVIASVEMVWGGDGPGSSYEAVVQATMGTGYDQDCDGKYDGSTDIQPFLASSSDAFGGSGGETWSSSTAGSGTTPGVGFRDGSKRVVVLFAENAIRDRDEGHTMPSATCFEAASRMDASAAVRGVGADLLGVNSYEFQDMDPVLQQQLLDLVDRTGSKIDADGDGVKDDPAVLSGSWDWPPTAELVDAIWDLAGA